MNQGPHTPVLRDEAVEGLMVRPDGIYVDCTFGRGGHSRLILERLGERGRLIALDRDAEAVASQGGIDDGRLHVVHSAFSRLREVVADEGVAGVDGILLDLGVSSAQLDDPARGFSFRFDAPLDMRMDRSRGRTAAEWLAEASEQELREVIRDYGEERFAKQIAAALVAARRRNPVLTTRELAGIVAAAVRTREPGQHPATRAFQALRIHVNQELEELKAVLPQCVGLMRARARIAIISFHSLEDRIVKRFLRGESQTPQVPRRLPLKAAEMPRPKLRVIGKALRPRDDEVERNARARSAILRIAERVEEA